MAGLSELNWCLLHDSALKPLSICLSVFPSVSVRLISSRLWRQQLNLPDGACALISRPAL